MDELLKDFLIEAGEALDGYDQDLVKLEINPSDYETLNRIFRAMHTIKGTCGFLGFSRMEKLTHAAEFLLDDLRSGIFSVTGPITNSLLEVGDAVRGYLHYIEQHGEESPKDYIELIAKINAQREDSSSKTIQSDTKQKQNNEESLEDAFARLRDEWVANEEQEVDPVYDIEEQDSQEVQIKALDTGTSELNIPEAIEQKIKPAKPASTKLSASETSLRVDVNLLDELMNLVGELVLTRNQLLQYTKNSKKDPVFQRTSQRLNLITSELQESVMRTRMQPISNVWNKFPRIVRDIAQTCGKEVRLEMIGKETDLDKTIIEAIKDPMTHLVRNAIDHGIETAEKRVESNKDPEGVLTLHAFHEGGHVIIEISDDGAGLNLKRIREKAIQKGFVTEVAAAHLSDSEVAKFIFEAGFSTQDQVSNISGRGVGMDVVRSNIDKIGGAIDISSDAGKGTKFKIKIPLTLAIVPALLISSGGERYAIPQVSLQELVRVEGEQIWNEIEEVNGVNYYRLRGRLLPLVYLSYELGLPPANEKQALTSEGSEKVEQSVVATQKSQIRSPKKSKQGVINIVVVRADDRTFGLVVDEIHDTEEIVVKPLKGSLKEIPVYAGATIMGDGYIALILDIVGLAEKSGVDENLILNDSAITAGTESGSVQCNNILLARLDNNRRIGIPLEQITRLENITNEKIEFANNWPVIQYRGTILPLVYFESKPKPGDTSQPGFAIVHKSGTQTWGFVVREILDVTSSSQNSGKGDSSTTWHQSAIIDNVVTDLLDLPLLLNSLSPSSDSRKFQ
jgi:two-component system, chemotaxis family, sensor kinase CheA